MTPDPRRPYSLQRRLIWRTLGGFALVWALVMAWVAVDARHELDELLDAHLTQTAALLLVQQISDGDDDAVVASHSYNNYSSNVAYQVFRAGELVAASANAGQKALSGHTQGFATVQRSDGQFWRVYVAHSTNSDVRVFVAEAISGRIDIVWALLRGMLLPFALALPLWGFVVWLNTRRSLNPLSELSLQVMSAGTANLTPVHVANLPIEVQPLEDALNTLLSQLAERMESERRFTADAAHELRTPIAAIRAQAQVALMAEPQDQINVRQQALQDTIRACDRANRLVSQLLALSRLETEPISNSKTSNIYSVLQQVMSDFYPVALSRGQKLELNDQVKNLSLFYQRYPETVLQILFRNLLDNALRYTPDQGEVQVNLCLADSAYIDLIFEDSGPGMNEADRARLGDRFFRVLGTGQNGSGLGWSIIRQITRLYEIPIEVCHSKNLGGLKVTLKLNISFKKRG